MQSQLLPKAVIFDMDGVIFDTEVIARCLWREVFKEYGYDFSDATYRKLIGCTMHAAFQILAEEYGPELPISEMATRQDALWQEATAKAVPIKPGVIEILDFLKGQDIPCAVGSSTYHAEAEDKLQTNGLRDYFQTVVGGDYVAHAKPAPDIFLKCAEYLGFQPADCLVIEDSNNGLRAAHVAGIPAVMIPDLIPASEIDADLSFTAYNSLLDLLDNLKQLTE
ncbi:MAG: HAD family phosphatase [Coriobacteriia bacterium]|nr:HAD family phosphatase [Coriobacteriia bacterium]